MRECDVYSQGQFRMQKTVKIWAKWGGLRNTRPYEVPQVESPSLNPA